MTSNTSKQELLRQYEDKANGILLKMYQTVLQAQRKVDDTEYRKILEKLEKDN